MVRIVEIRNATAATAAPIATFYSDLGTMTASVVAVVTDAVRDGRPVIGDGFSSTGRPAARGLPEDRFLRRLSTTDVGAYAADDGSPDPHWERDLLFAGENLFSIQDASNPVRYGSVRPGPT